MTNIEKLTKDLVANLLSAVAAFRVLIREAAVPVKRPRGLAAFSPEQRSIIAKKAALTRKRRAAARKAVETRRARAI